MRSTRSLWGSVVFLAALPLAVVCQTMFGVDAETVFHFELALGCLLLDPNAFDSSAWVKATGVVATGMLGVIFALQGFAQASGNAALSHLGFAVLGQWPEGLFVDLLLIWLLGVLVTGPGVRYKFIGWVCVAAAITAKIVAYILPLYGPGSDGIGPFKLALLLPFVWLVLETRAGLGGRITRI